MASNKKKTVISKDDLRRLMKEKQTTLKSAKKRIDSPLARYNTLDQLSCILCNTPVKNELLWNAHIIGRTHKENLARLKTEKEQKQLATVPPPDTSEQKKRKLADEEILAIAKGVKPFPHKNKNKKVKNSGSEASDTETSETKKPRSILKTSVTYQQQINSAPAAAASDNDSAESEKDEKDVQSTATTSKTTAEPGLPPDFFDSGSVPAAPPDGSTDNSQAEISAKLPEGFFDDPKQDAKIRQVEYKDKMDEEWEMFQRVINEETYTSEAIQAEDDEEANEERHLLEVEEQLKKWSKIDELAKKKEKLMLHETEVTEKTNSDEESVDELEFDEFLDWRSKKAWK